MSRNIFIWLVICGCAAPAIALKVSIYYETLCGDTIHFFVHQFAPAYSVIRNNIHVDLVPFGKATAVNNSGTWNFTCQGGPNECHGNKVHSCVVELYHMRSPEFAICAFQSGNAASDANLQLCATENNITWSTIQECMTSGQADELHAANGIRTTSVEPEITFVPTIIYNDIFKVSLQNLSLENFFTLATFLQSNTNVEVAISSVGPIE
ncbi:hypothetical protein NQ314_004416 [Rhamnusium bicolor]|uniref:Gamma-interferon-inducible lysosomal thiol reductase n=1 Tax=Rhamnusium bicolor TaxID=1586634 RepID=A0AAV8ZKH4_9CUCU|nr:hypothetical protein NQ314_004416 [Rhamnusium bicolor]